MAFLTYCTTPLTRCNLTPAQLLMGRHLQTTLPQVDDHFQPQWKKYLETFRTLNKLFKEKQKIDFDRRHQIRPLPLIPDNTDVISSGQTITPGQISSEADTP